MYHDILMRKVRELLSSCFTYDETEVICNYIEDMLELKELRQLRKEFGVV